MLEPSAPSAKASTATKKPVAKTKPKAIVKTKPIPDTKPEELEVQPREPGPQFAERVDGKRPALRTLSTQVGRFAPVDPASVLGLRGVLGNRDVARLLGVQPKLSIGTSGDAFEQEADRTADAVMKSDPSVSHSGCSCGAARGETCQCGHHVNASSVKVQRFTPKPMGRASVSARGQTPASVDQVLRQAGSPLPAPVRHDMESRFGHDFSDVRVHTDSAAQASTRHIAANAYTAGTHIVFGAGRFAPASRSGAHLLAHELTHVLQQRAGTVQRSVQRDDDEEKKAHLSQELIPTAAISIDLGSVMFTVNTEATFAVGPKTIQLLRIALKALLQEQYTDAIAVDLAIQLDAKKTAYQRSGHFQDKRDAYEGEEIHQFWFGIEPFTFILKFLRDKKLTVHLSDEELEQLRTAVAAGMLWVDVKHAAAEEGFPFPAWYGEAMFAKQMSSRGEALADYKGFVSAYHETHDEEAKAKGKEAATAIFYDVYNDVVFLEALRKDVSLYKDPTTDAAYQSVWYITDKQRDAGKPALGLRSLDNAFALLDFANKYPDLRRNFETRADARRDLIGKFIAEHGLPEHNLKLLPPYPALIVAPDLNEDNSTVTTASNMFRFIANTEAVHGMNLLNGVTIAMARSIEYSWEVVPLPESLAYMRREGHAEPKALVKEADTFVKNSPENLQAPVKRYSPIRDDYEKTIKMKDFAVGDFLLVGRAVPHYRADMHWVQRPSSAGYPFSVFDAKTLATNTAFTDWDRLQSLKDQQNKTTDESEKKQLQEDIDRMTKRESGDLLALNKQDIKDAEDLISHAKQLKVFIELSRQQNLPMAGDAKTDPFIVRLKIFKPVLHDVYLMIREMYDPRRYDDLTAIDEYVKLLENQNKELKKTGLRVDDAYTRFKPGSPTFRVVAALVKSDDGNIVPLLLVAGYHPDADPATGKHKIKLVDVTFDSKKQDMIYVGGTRGTEQDAVQSAFVEFGEDNHYGNGQIVYRLPATPYQGQAASVTTIGEYLQYALAAAGVIMLILGTLATAGALSPVAVGVVTALGVSLAVVGAAMAVRNIEKRKEKGTFEFDTETALDIVNIIGAVVMVIGTVTRVTAAARAATLARVMMVQRLEKLIAVYDLTELGANIYLMSVKVKEDVDAIKKLGLPKYEEDAMISSVVFDAVQQGAMMAFSAHSMLKQIPDTFRAHVETSPYKSWEEKGWIKVGENGHVEVTNAAPPFLQKTKTKAGIAAPPDQQGEMAHLAVVVEPLHQNPTKDGQHNLTVTERGRIIRCSDFCQDLRARYQTILEQDPQSHNKLLEIEKKAVNAAANEDKVAAKEALAEATVLEASLRHTEDQWKRFTKSAATDDTPAEPLDLTGAETKSAGGAPAGAGGGDGARSGRPGRLLDVVDLMTEAEQVAPDGMQSAVTRLGHVLGQTVTDVPVLKKHWDAAVQKVLKGKAVTDYKPNEVNNKLFPQANKEFWKRVAADPDAVALLERTGLTIGKSGGEPQAKLGPAAKGKKGAAESQERRVQILPKDQADDWTRALDADNLAFSFKQPAAPATPAPPPKARMMLTPDEQRLATHGKSLGMLDTEVELYIEHFRRHGMSVEDMVGQMNVWAETLKANPKARARIAPDFIMDAATRARLPDFEQKIAGTGGIESITAREMPAEGGLVVTIIGMILPKRLARKTKDVTKTRRAAPEFNSSDKLFSNTEAGLSKDWQRLHLWGPGFGDEAAAGMMWGPREVNHVWQNESVETYIRAARDVERSPRRHDSAQSNRHRVGDADPRWLQATAR